MMQNKLKITLGLTIYLYLMVCGLASVIAVTDAELEAIEKQIEQQEAEAEEKKKEEVEAKRKAEKKRNAKVEAKINEKRMKEEEEAKRIADAEVKRMEEKARLAELERKRQGEDNLRAKKEKNNCSKIIGVWQWNDLMKTKTRFYEDGKVISKNILKSEGNWECVDPENKRFTFNTWNKKRDIQIEDDNKKLYSVGVLGEKLIANKISDNPLEKVVPAQNSNSKIRGL